MGRMRREGRKLAVAIGGDGDLAEGTGVRCKFAAGRLGVQV